MNRLECSFSDRFRRVNAGSRRSPRTSSTVTIARFERTARSSRSRSPAARRASIRRTSSRVSIQDDRGSYRDVAAFVNAHPCELLNIQHEYGLFGGEDGEWIVDLLALVRKPVVVSLHTVLPEPTPEHLRVARTNLRDARAAIVVLSQTGKDILVERYGIDPAKVHVIHHGVPDVPFRDTDAAKGGVRHRATQVISTFGLINRGKGLEYAIEAMRDIVRRIPTRSI